MSLTPKQLTKLSQTVVDLYIAIENELLINMANVIKQDRELLLTAEDGTDYEFWRIRQLNKIGGLTNQNIKTIAKYAGKAPKEVKLMLESAAAVAIDHVEPTLQQAVNLGLLVANAPSPKTSVALLSILSTYEQQALNTLNLTNTTILNQSQQAYLDVINQTVGKVLAGNITPQQALRQTVSSWAERGIPALIDKRGAKWSTEAYVSMVTRTTSNNVANNMQFERMNQYGSDLIEVSSKLGARPRCEPFQGKIYSRNGTHTKYPAFSTTSYGEPAGLLGINCGHVIYPFIEGLNTQTYTPYDSKENDRVYKESQVQRKLERSIRKAKQEMRVLQAMGDTVGAVETKKKVSIQQAAMREFIKKTGRKRRTEREQIV